MNMKFIKNIVLILCSGFFCLYPVKESFAQIDLSRPKYEFPSVYPTNNNNGWNQQNNNGGGQNQNNNNDKDGGQNNGGGTGGGDPKAPESIAAPKSYQQILNDLSPWSEYSASAAAEKCQGAYSADSLKDKDQELTPDTAGLFSPDIMVNMKLFMTKVYEALTKPLMIGHSLMCYANNVAYFCVGKEPYFCVIKLANLNLFFSGLLIYIVGVLMAMSIGMYFVDISFKLGFAMLFMPVSIALWPFPPTKNKLGENLSTIIRNGMLFALVAIGVVLSVTLIENSLFSGGTFKDGISSFWEAVANKSTQALTENFSFVEISFLVTAFGVIFAFKILASSINDYLDYFFSDSAFGSESPMHHMGTQAIGMLKANTVDKAASFAKDVAKTQTGRALAGVGGGIAKLGSSKGRKELADSIKNKAGAVGHAIVNPRQTYNAAMGKIGEKTGEAIEKVGGSMVKGVVNSLSMIAPIKESTRKKAEKWMDEKIDKGAKVAGKWVENKIAHGGGQLQNLAADATAAGINAYNRKIIGDNGAKTVTRDDVKQTVGESLESAKGDVIRAARYTAAVGRKIGGGAKDIASAVGGAVEEGAKQLVNKVATDVYNTVQDIKCTTENSVTTDEMREMLSDTKKKLAQATRDAWKDADKAPITLQPSALLKAPFKGTKGAVKGAYKHLTSIESWVNDMEKLATGWEKFQKAKDDKVILKKTGQIVLRTAARTIKGTGQDAKKVAEGTASVFGNVLKDFGESLQNNAAGGQGFVGWNKIHEEEERKKAAAQEERDFFNSLEGKYDNDK